MAGWETTPHRATDIDHAMGRRIPGLARAARKLGLRYEIEVGTIHDPITGTRLPPLDRLHAWLRFGSGYLFDTPRPGLISIATECERGVEYRWVRVLGG
jgi:hypothetical protein